MSGSATATTAEGPSICESRLAVHADLYLYAQPADGPRIR